MLHILHHQTSAYHPESNGAVERLHHRLRMCFGPRSYPLYSSASVQSQGKTLVFPRLRQFLALQLTCPMNFCKETNFLLIQLLKNFYKSLDSPAFSLPRHNSTSQLPAELPDELLHTPFFWLCRAGIVPPLHHPYNGPYTVLQRGPCSFTISVDRRTRLSLSAASRPAWKRMPRVAARPSCRNQAGLVFRPIGFFAFLFSGAATQWSRNSFTGH
jgi:hypothetical protein